MNLTDRLQGGGSGMFRRGTEAAEQAAQTEAPRTEAAHSTTKPNRYAGKCRNCGGHVAEGKGYLGPRVDGAWTVEHVQCDQATEVIVADAQPERVIDFRIPARIQLLEGTYTVVFEDGDYRTIKIERQEDWADFMPGKLLLGYLSGPDNEHSFTRFANVTDDGFVVIWKRHRDNAVLAEAVKVLCADPKAAARAYGLRSRRCGICGRKLSTPESIEAGIGPVCAERF